MTKLISLVEADREREDDIYLYWEDCDLNAERPPEEILKLEFEAGQSDEPFESDLFILMEGDYIIELIHQTVLNKDTVKICTIPGTAYGIKTPSMLFKYKNILIAIMELDVRFSAEVEELLRPYVELAKKVVTLSIKPTHYYRTEDSEEVKNDLTFIRGINSELSNIDELKAPNLIHGAAAGAASWRTFKNLPVSSYVAYVTQTFIDPDSGAKILQVLRDLGLECSANYIPKRREIFGVFI